MAKSSADREKDAIICDGAIRSGKTLSMSLGFFLWAMTNFHGMRFALCGKTVGAVRRNVLAEVTPWLAQMGMDFHEHRSENRISEEIFNKVARENIIRILEL